jgi:hypothetical protein
MPLEFRADCVALVDACGAEDALELADWFARSEAPKADLAACTHLHAALLQTLLAYEPSITAAPVDPFLARWILPLLTTPDVKV